MSFHKLKIGSRKKESTRSAVNSTEKLKQKNDQMNLNLQTKLHSRKANIITMSDDFNHEIFKLKKHQYSTAPKTDRLHKIERMDSVNYGEVSKTNEEKTLHFSYNSGEENQEYSATQMIQFLNVKQTQNKVQDGSSLKLVRNSNTGTSLSGYHSEKGAVTESIKPRVHQIKQMTPTEVENKVKQAFEIRKKVIELQEQPLNCEIVLVKKQSSQAICEEFNNSGTDQARQVNQQTAMKLSQVISEAQQNSKGNDNVVKEERVLNVIKKKSWSSNVSVETRDNKDSQTVIVVEKLLVSTPEKEKIIVKTPERQKKEELEEVKVKKESPASQKSIKSHTTQQPKPIVDQKKPTVISNPPTITTNTASQSYNTSQISSQQTISQISPTKSKLSYRPINEVQVTILQQNKLLTQQIQKLRRQRDELQFMTKRYQVQLMQSNCQDYYQREIKRLRNQVQTLQSVHEELKHNNFQLQNRCKQLESTEEINRRQLKKLLKQLQIIKIDSTKQKYELKQKSASLLSVTKQLQQRNQDLSNKFDDYYKRFNQLQKVYKLKCEEQYNIKKYSMNLQTKLVNGQKVAMEKFKHYENGLNNHTSAKNVLEAEYRQYKRQSQTQIQSLRQSIKQLSLKRQSQALLISSRIKTLQKHNNTIQAELQVVRLQQTVKQQQLQITKRSQLIRQLNNKIDAMIGMQDYEELRKQLEIVNVNKTRIVQEYEKQVMGLNVSIQQLRNKLQHAQKELRMMENDHVLCETNKPNSQARYPDHSIIQKQNFRQILKQQILQSDNLKHQLFSKSQLHYKLKEEYQELKIRYQAIKNQQQIMRKQFSSYENNSKVKNDILHQELVNEIDSTKRKMTLLEKRFDSKIKENKQKEQFIKDFIIGNNGNPNDSQYLVKELERIFLEKEKSDAILLSAH